MSKNQKSLVIDRKVVTWGAILILLGFVMWAISPLTFFHGLWFNSFALNPVFWALLAIGAFVTIRLSDEISLLWLLFVVITFIVAIVLFSLWGTGLTNKILAQSLNPTILSSLENTTKIRYLPMAVAETFGDNKIQESTHSLGDMDPLDIGGELDWVAPRVPNGFWNQLTGRSDGFQIVKSDGSVETRHQPMRYGEGMWFANALTWQLWRIHYGVDLPEFYYLVSGDEVLAMGPYIGYRFEFPAMIPYWMGVFVVHPDGRIEDLKPEQAISDPRFEGQRLFPEALALKIANAWAYKDGMFNAWFIHKDQIEVPTIENSENQMPYLMPTAKGPVWFVGMEPFGPAYSIYKMLFFDAHTGAASLYEIPQEQGIVGPNKALNYAESAFPNYQWYRKGDKEASGTIVAIEPRPVIKNETLWWQISITTTNYAGISKTVLVNGKTNEVRYFNNLEELKGFVAGTFDGYAINTQSASTPTSAAVQPTMDINKMSDSEIYSLIQGALEELKKRHP